MAILDDPSLLNAVAIETSSRTGSVAVGRGGTVLAVRRLPADQRHAVELMPAISELVAGQGWHPAQIAHLYVSLGPGSFTGLRIAVAVARAIAQATGCRIVGVPSLDVLAENASGEFGVVVPVLDAKRGQVFAARYVRRPDGRLEQMVPPALVDPRAFVAESVAKGGGQPVALLGEGVAYHRAELLAGGAGGRGVVELDPALWVPRAEVVYHLAARRAAANSFDDPQTLLPIYIRLPEAEEVWRKKHGLPVGEIRS